MRLKRILNLFSIATLSLFLVACSSKEVPTQESKEVQKTEVAEATNEEYPIVIKHAYGETVIEEQPERIVTIGWANQDTPLALGVVPTGYSMANFGPVDRYGMHPWTAERVAELGEENPNVFQDTAGIDFEAVSDSTPDIILAAYSGLTQEEYDLLSEIAPVVAYPNLPWATYWRDQIVINATAMGMKEEGEAYVKDMEALIAEKVSQYPQLSEVTGAFVWVDATDLSSFYLYTPVDTRAAYLTDLGIEFPEELSKQVPTDAFYLTVSAENIDLLKDLDILVAYGNESLLEAMQADPLFATVPAVQKGAVALIDSNSNIAGAATPSALSIPAVIDEYTALLAEAADKVK